MKKAIIICFAIFLLAILIFVITIFSPVTDTARWRMFSITMPIAGISFCSGAILGLIYLVRTSEK